MKKSKKHNLKYWISEGTAVFTALAGSTLTAILMDKVSDSDALISAVSAFGGTVGFLSGTIGVYAGLHAGEYKRGEREFRKDMKDLFRSNIEGITTTYALRFPIQYSLQKLGMYPGIAAPVSHILGGIAGGAVRIIRNYQRNIFGNRKIVEKKIDKTRINNHRVLEDF